MALRSWSCVTFALWAGARMLGAQQDTQAVEASLRTSSPALPPGVAAPVAWLDQVLLAAGENRRELEAALIGFSAERQPFEYAAMQWLVTHLEGHGYARFTWFDRYGDRIDVPLQAFDRPGDFADYWAALQRERGPLQAGIERFESDAMSLTAEELRQHVELAVLAWRERPWTWELDPALFFHGVLPHRVGNEPLDDWRRVLFDTFSGIEESLEDPHDPLQAAAWIRRSTRSWAQATEDALWRPSDQSLREMLSSREGRSEDLAHLEVMALRANALPATLDFVPAWGARVGNHAWSRLLLEGAPAPELRNRVAKVLQRRFVATEKPRVAIPGRRISSWLSDPHLRDVTADYVAAQDLILTLPERQGGRYALAVWQGQSWVPITFGEGLAAGRVLFAAMGPDLVYLPMYCDAVGDHVLGAPVVLAADGWVQPLDGVQFESPGDWGAPAARSPMQPAEINGLACAASTWAPTEKQRLLIWKDAHWQELERQQTVDGRTWWELPLGYLALLQPEEGWDALARPFTLRHSAVSWW